jgi:two-component system, sensor histidine kinase
MTSLDAVRLATLVRNLSLGVLVEDEHRRVVLVNERFCAMFGINAPPEALVGGDCAEAAEAVKPLFLDPEAFLASNLRCLADGVPTAAEVLPMADGRLLEREYAPVQDGGRFLGHLWTYRDVTVAKQAEQAISDRDERLRLAIDGARLGTYDLDLRTGRATVNDHYLAPLGFAAGEQPMDFESWQQSLHRDDLAGTLAALEEHLAGRTPWFHAEYRQRRRDGGWVWISDRGQVVGWDATGAPTRLCGTHLDITERKTAELAVAAARDAAERAASVREQFLASVSHELRTPLNAVLGLSHLLERTTLDDEQQRSVQGIRYAGDVLLGVINDLLDLTRMRSGKLAFEATPFSPRAVLESLAHVQRHVAAARGLTLDLHIADDLPEAVEGDPVRLNQILLNLVSNAIKFTETGGVTITASCDPRPTDPCANRLRFAVRDSGIGIAPEDRERIFGTFQQATVDTPRRFGGSGLGLAIVRELTERMGGSLSVESALGVGSTFHVSIPFCRAEAPPAQPNTADAVRLDGRHVLLVEDNDLNREVARRILEEAGARVSTASNGRKAVELVALQPFDLVLMDIQMPEMDGFEATWRIRYELGISPRQLPVVALTATALTDERRRAEASGMTDYIFKPFRPDTLLQRVAALTSSERPAEDAQDVEDLQGFVRTLASLARTGEYPVSMVSGAATVQMDGPPLVDEDILKRLARLPGNDAQDLATELVESFAGRMPSVLDQMRAGIDAGDAREVARAAHSLRGAALQLGAGPLAALAGRLEAAAQAGVREGQVDLLDTLETEWPMTDAALRAACAHAVTPPSAPPNGT